MIAMKNIKFKLRENKNEPVQVPNINFLNKYSLDEQKVGTWIDGKDLYQVTLEIVLPQSSTWAHLLDITRYNIDTVISYTGILVHTSAKVGLQLDYDDGNSRCVLQIIPYRIQALYTSNFIGNTIYVTIQYTKKD